MNNTLNDSILASLPVAVMIVNDANCIVDINPAAESLLNCSSRYLSGWPITALVENAETLDDSLSQVRERQAPILVDDFTILPLGRDQLLSTIQIAPVADQKDQLLICIRSREIEGKIGYGTRAKSAARSAVGLADVLSHEIRNPLSGIVGAAQLLSMNVQGDDLELTELIVEEAHRIKNLLEQVDQFGQTVANNCVALNVHNLLNHTRRIASVGCAAGVRIETQYDPSLPEVWADSDLLLRVFLNLIQNASEALVGEEGYICIRTHYDKFLRLRNEEGKEKILPVHVEVIDNGRGLNPEIAANAFEPFVSGRKNGTGLGLALVSAILSDIGGWVSFESQPGHTVFRVSLPVATKAMDAF